MSANCRRRRIAKSRMRSVASPRQCLPKIAVDLTVLATDIAESLDPAAYPADTVMKLRATAWRERAYALYYVGSYTESLAALDRVDESLARCLVSEFDGARAQL